MQVILKQPTGTRFVRRDVNLDVEPTDPASALRVVASVPNPFVLGATLRFETPRPGYATVRIYDTAGRLVRDLDRPPSADRHSIAWDGLDQRGAPAPTGVLFLEVAVDGMEHSSKLVRLN